MSFAVRFATEKDAPGIRALFHRVFAKEMPAEEWAWKYARNPDGWLGAVAELGGEIVGNYSGCGMRFVLGAEERVAYAIGDVATDPRARHLGGRKGVFREMAEAFYAEVGRRGLPFCFGFPNDRALAVSHRFAGTESLRPIVERRVPCASLPAAPAGFDFGDSVGEGFDGLWSRARSTLGAGAVRDRLRVNWRFHARPTRYYRMLWRGGREPESWAVLSVLGEQAIVADYLAADGGGPAIAELFAACGAEAARLGARELVFWETPGGPGAAAVADLPGASAPAGFTLIARVFDAGAVRLFNAGHLAPALYDVT